MVTFQMAPGGPFSLRPQCEFQTLTFLWMPPSPSPDLSIFPSLPVSLLPSGLRGVPLVQDHALHPHSGSVSPGSAKALIHDLLPLFPVPPILSCTLPILVSHHLKKKKNPFNIVCLPPGPQYFQLPLPRISRRRLTMLGLPAWELCRLEGPDLFLSKFPISPPTCLPLQSWPRAAAQSPGLPPEMASHSAPSPWGLNQGTAFSDFLRLPHGYPQGTSNSTYPTLDSRPRPKPALPPELPVLLTTPHQVAEPEPWGSPILLPSSLPHGQVLSLLP